MQVKLEKGLEERWNCHLRYELTFWALAYLLHENFQAGKSYERIG